MDHAVLSETAPMSTISTLPQPRPASPPMSSGHAAMVGLSATMPTLSSHRAVTGRVGSAPPMSPLAQSFRIRPASAAPTMQSLPARPRSSGPALRKSASIGPASPYHANSTGPVLHCIDEFTEVSGKSRQRLADILEREKAQFAEVGKELHRSANKSATTIQGQLDRAGRMKSLQQLLHITEEVGRMPETASHLHDAVLAEWLSGYHEEQESFASATLRTQVLLSKAKVFTENMEQPNSVLTLAAFEAFDALIEGLGRYRPMLQVIRDILYRAVYDENSASEVEGGPPFVPYFTIMQAAQRQREELFLLAERLQQKLANMQRDAAQTQQTLKKSANVLDKWKSAAAKTRQANLASNLEAQMQDQQAFQNMLSSLRQPIVKQGPRSRDDVLRDFFQLDAKSRAQAMRHIIRKTPDQWPELSSFLIELQNNDGRQQVVRAGIQMLPQEMIVATVEETLTDRGSISLRDEEKLLSRVLDKLKDPDPAVSDATWEKLIAARINSKPTRPLLIKYLEPAAINDLFGQFAALMPIDVLRSHLPKHVVKDIAKHAAAFVERKDVEVQVNLGSMRRPKQQPLPEEDVGWAVSLPWAKYLILPPGVALPRVEVGNVLTLIYDTYEAKILADARDDALSEGRELPPNRTAMGDFVKEVLLHKFGLPSLRDNYMYSLVQCIRKNAATSARVRMFGVMCGAIDEELYSPRMSDIVLHLLQCIFVKFSSAALRSRKEGTAFVTLSLAQTAIADIFVTAPLQYSIDKLFLTEGRRATLANALLTAAVPTDSVPTVYTGSGLPDAKAVNLDYLISLCVDTWRAQHNADKQKMREIYVAFDTDGDGILSVAEFRSLLSACVQGTLSDRSVLRLYEQLCSTGSQKRQDIVTADMFVQFCCEVGLTPILSAPQPVKAAVEEANQASELLAASVESVPSVGSTGH